MKQQSYTVRFLTPAFLGNAEQSGQWRTPPFKALLRQWWRVAVAQELEFDVRAIRAREADHFGVAADGGDSHKSHVRIRLDDWSEGEGKAGKVLDIGQVQMGKNQIAASLYSAYGPVEKGPKLRGNVAIQSGAEARLRIAFPEDSSIDQALALMHTYGTVGGRSRNGWGSFELIGEHVDLKPIDRDWQKAMQMDWPHALGKDHKELVWTSSPQTRWEDAMNLLAQARVDMRRAVPDRLMLAYPDTKATMPGWDKNDRVPHSLRFKVRSEGSQFVAVIFHMPCRPADELWEKLSPEKQKGFEATFAAAHAFLDTQQKFKRIKV